VVRDAVLRVYLTDAQNQLLACIQWLAEFQVLACIPLSGSVPAKDVADLAGVSESQLRRVVRMTATAGFLQEPQPEHIAHTALSAPFVTKLAYLDAAVFLAETAAPSALHMAQATQRHGSSGLPAESAYNLAFNTAQTFQSACEQRAALQCQWPAYLRCTGDADGGVTELLTRLDWLSLGSACIVDVSTPPISSLSVASRSFLVHRSTNMARAVLRWEPARSDLPRPSPSSILLCASWYR